MTRLARILMVQNPSASERDTTLDVLRGIAIFLMVQANIGQSVYHGAIPLWVKLYIATGSFVPALFILLAGMSVAYTSTFKHYTLKHFLLRMVTLFVTAAVVIDVFVWGLVPFVGVDVLYLIGLALPVAYGFQRLSSAWRWLCVLIVFASTPLLQAVLGYANHPTAIHLSGGARALGELDPVVVAKHWLVDGWFPIVPWLGFGLLGVNLGLRRWKTKSLATFARRKVIVAGVLLMILGLVMWTFYRGALYSRSGFREIFYPPSLAYIVTVVGQIVILFAFVDWRPNLRVYKPLVVYGESALFMYWTHHVIMKYLKPVHSVGSAFLVLGTGVVITFALAYALRYVRRRWPHRPAFLRHVLGV
jgi:uncharacterized membrane protein